MPIIVALHGLAERPLVASTAWPSVSNHMSSGASSLRMPPIGKNPERDSPLEEIAAIVKAKVRPYECNDAGLRQIKESMEMKPLDAVQIAKAYFSSQALRKLEQFQDDPMHTVQVLLNDLLVCKIRMDGNCNENFEQAITNVAGGNCLNRNQMSQFKHAFNKIKTCGQSRAEFDKNFGLSVQEEVPLGVEAPRKKPHPYKDLNATEQDDIYKAFSACAELLLTYGSNSSRRKGRKIRNRTELSYKLDVLEGHLKGMQHELSLLKKQEQEQSEKLQAARLSKIAEHNIAVALLLEKWTWQIHAFTPADKLLRF